MAIAKWIGAEEREGKIKVRVCVGKEMMMWQTLIGYLSQWRIDDVANCHWLI